VNAPDLVLFVGEALVGNEAIEQLVQFNAALADHSSSDKPHTIDGIGLIKFDTIVEVGSAISMTYIRGRPSSSWTQGKLKLTSRASTPK
jgi:signal recognition particle receptor subunit alpha